jgi:hypothetical protein
MRTAIILLILLVLCCGCEKDRFIDTGAILVDRDLLPENVEVK